MRRSFFLHAKALLEEEITCNILRELLFNFISNVYSILEACQYFSDLFCLLTQSYS